MLSVTNKIFRRLLAFQIIHRFVGADFSERLTTKVKLEKFTTCPTLTLSAHAPKSAFFVHSATIDTSTGVRKTLCRRC